MLHHMQFVFCRNHWYSTYYPQAKYSNLHYWEGVWRGLEGKEKQYEMKNTDVKKYITN